MHHLLSDGSQIGFEDLHIARLRRPPPGLGLTLRVRKPNISKERHRKASKERYETHEEMPVAPMGMPEKPAAPCAPRTPTEQQASPGSEQASLSWCNSVLDTLQDDAVSMLPTPSQSEAFLPRSNTDQAMSNAPHDLVSSRDLVSSDLLDGRMLPLRDREMLPLHRIRLALALGPAPRDWRHVSQLKEGGINLAGQVDEIDDEVDEITCKSTTCPAIFEPCDLAISQAQLVRPDISTRLTCDASRTNRSSPSSKVTRIKGVNMHEDYFGVHHLTRMEPSNLLLPSEAGGPPRPSHWPAPRPKVASCAL